MPVLDDGRIEIGVEVGTTLVAVDKFADIFLRALHDRVARAASTEVRQMKGATVAGRQ
ncbi:hypothetical protein K788_00005515 [Paraburkholderia caribensis MBA4]|uniref:Uncharacterized protein n=1 Tax=Paraburkholderia caribensis MBA4 TaxID=1323664 RepID=A0A0P0RH35_9BURK|nr:hypothetical protein K788_00005515 [Paraburkholderia caribensis MBA4]